MANDWYNYLLVIQRIEPFWDVLTGNAAGFFAEDGIEYGFKVLISLTNMIFDPETNSSLQAMTVIISLFCYTVLFYVTYNEDTIKHKFLFYLIDRVYVFLLEF